MAPRFQAAIILCLQSIGVSNYSYAGLIAIPPETFSWKITGVIGEAHTLYGSPLPAAAGDPYTIDLIFELNQMFEQCSPCEGTGDTEWRGEITGFSVNLAGTELVADIGAHLPNFVIFQPGDDPTEVDYVSIRLGNRGYDGLLTPVPLAYDGGVLDAAFTFYVADFSGVFFDEGAGPWRRDMTWPTSASASSDKSLFIAEQPYTNPFAGALFNLDVDSVKAVPEPHVLTLFMMGLLSLGLFNNRNFVGL